MDRVGWVASRYRGCQRQRCHPRYRDVTLAV